MKPHPGHNHEKIVTEQEIAVALSKESRVFFRDEFRNARAVALKNAEEFEGLLFAVERLGGFLWGALRKKASEEDSRKRRKPFGDMREYLLCQRRMRQPSPRYL